MRSLNKPVYSTSTRGAAMRTTRVRGMHAVAAAPRWFCLRAACLGKPSETAAHGPECGPEHDGED